MNIQTRDSYLPLQLRPDSLSDSLGTIRLEDLPDLHPQHKGRLKNPTPLIEKLWRIALSDVEKNIVTSAKGTYLGAGTAFGTTVFTRDIAYSGLLGLNRLYPDLIRESLEYTRRLHLEAMFTVPKGYCVEDIDVDWNEIDLSEKEYAKNYEANYMRRTDDVIWLWCAGDLAEREDSLEIWKWIYDRGTECFEKLYQPFFDPSDGLYRGQASFIDVHFSWKKATGYPQDWTIGDCVRIKATSTNCLYAKGLAVMATAAAKLGHKEESGQWRARSEAVKEAISRELKFKNGTFSFFKYPNGSLENRRECLGTAFVVLLEIVRGEEGAQALAGYPVTDAGIPLFHPFFTTIDQCYHNHSTWPFADNFFLQALEKSDGQDRSGLKAALLARTCREDGSFHELVDFRDKSIHGSKSQLWTAAAFLGTCLRGEELSSPDICKII